ncbi:DUF1573 domain-containing protein [Aquiflexum sp. TKW24L]|uniref:DUF1573 domain-containing protein n=1 Tax=Aquiflexum sp. TKW24L TaxID=2942212 RepID=UPI0020C158C7|nr:DUF1573 domain-containing protein [Aquiflexum sp. TKW24L]MCL6261712.1 DUF1573 domain-containing protein [Aquiflexum sp. TKW24L]
MKKSALYLSGLILLTISSLPLAGQTIERKTLTWEKRKIDIGAVLEEKGAVEAEFFAMNENQDSIYITDIFTDCGCTTVDYSKDTLANGQIGSIKVKFDPDQRGGEFSKGIIIRTNLDIYGDTLFLEGINMPLPENFEMAFPHRVGELGFKLTAVNMGNIFTNEPKIRYVEIYNFGQSPIGLLDVQDKLPDYIKVSLEPSQLESKQRGLLIMTYDGAAKNDLGYFDEVISIGLDKDDLNLGIRVMSVVYEYFQPVPKSLENRVPKLGIATAEIDLREISANAKISRSITLTNMGQEPLNIRKVATNCDCVEVQLEKKDLEPGEKIELKFTFDPKGRRGIDHKHISIFTNDPLNPVRTIVVRSSIK